VTADILDASAWAAPIRDDLAAAAQAVPYRTIITVVLRYEFAREFPWYALVNPDGEHSLGWLAREECKPGHVPDGSLLVAQMAPGWSARRFDDPAEEVAADAAAHVADVLRDDRYAEPVWTDDVRWRHALAEGGVEDTLVGRAADRGLHVAGDWVAGEARLHAAIQSGLAAAERVTP
jgi:predicted NAD/FAD-dependent oxidoreductase